MNSMLLFSQVPTFQKTYGGSLQDGSSSVLQTADGGYIILGNTASFGSGGSDIILLRTDSNGDTLWVKTYGGSSDESGVCIQETNDSGFMVAGFAASNNIFLLKTNVNGDTLWTKTFAGGIAKYVQQTSDGGYVITGGTDSGTGNNAFLLKTNSNGGMLWMKEYGGGALKDEGITVQQTMDGGYIIVGHTFQFGQGQSDYYLVKTDLSGNILWSKTYGGTSWDYALSAQQTTDGGYILVGTTSSFGGGVYLVKSDSNGDTLWTRSFTGPVSEGWSVQQTFDGGYVIAGMKFSSVEKAFLLKTDVQGNLQWSKLYGTSLGAYGYSCKQTFDGGYVLAGFVGVSGNFGDIYLVKTDSDGNSGCNESTPTIISGSPSTMQGNPFTVSYLPSPLPVSFHPNTSTPLLSQSILCSTVGAEEYVEIRGAISICPNPSNGVFNLALAMAENIGPESVRIYNTLGEIVFSAPQRSNNIYVDLSGQNKGFYFLELISQKGIFVRKIIIQ